MNLLFIIADTLKDYNSSQRLMPLSLHVVNMKVHSAVRLLKTLETAICLCPEVIKCICEHRIVLYCTLIWIN